MAYTQLKDRNFVCMDFVNLYSTILKAFPISLREVKRPLKSPRREQCWCCCVVKMHLPCITKLSNSGMHRNPIDMLLECIRQIFFHYINSGFWQCQVELFVSRLWKDEGSTKNKNRKFRSIKCYTVNNWLWFYGNWIFRKRDFA